jgi:DHA1 family bicyclomycin/chloramphenicol resistance-like MFS transporter
LGEPGLKLAFPFALIVALSAMATDLYLPAIPAMTVYFGADIQVVELSISVYMLGFAVGNLVGAPVSDRAGRRPVMFAGLAVFLLATLLIIVCWSAEQLLALRFVQGVGGGLCAVNVMAAVGDMFAERDAALIFSRINMIVLVSPLVAPVIGVALVHFFSWHASFIFMGLYALIVIECTRRFVKETLRRKEYSESVADLLGNVAADYRDALTRPNAMWFNVVMMAGFGVFFVFLTDAAFLFVDYYAMPTWTFPLLFGACIVTMLVGNKLNINLLQRFSARQVIPGGHLVQLGATITMFAYASTTEPHLGILLPLIMLAIGGNAFIGGNTMARYISLFDKRRAVGSAVGGLLQFTTAGVLTILISVIHDGSPRTTAAGMLALALVGAAATARVEWAGRRMLRG